MRIHFNLLACKSKIGMLLLLLTFLVTPNLYAQNQVSGVVQDVNGEPLIGARVAVDGVKDGKATITDFDGKFTLEVPSLKVSLNTSYVGYQTTVTPLKGKSHITIVVEEDVELLDEVVVVGYGVQKKMTVTGSVAQVEAKDLLKAPSGNLTSTLAGKLPGLVSTQKSGAPGADGATLTIRGVSTLGNSSPMVIVDDVPRSFNSLDPNEIESITILKDATAAAVYGMQGASGVILVKTKRGGSSKPKITYTGKVAYNQNTNYPKFLDGPDFITYYNKALEMDGMEPLFSQDIYDKVVNGDPEGKYANTNWFNELMKNGAFSTHHNLSVNGGTDRSKYFVSLGYFNQDGIIDNIDYTRYNLRSNLDVDLSHGLTLGLDLAMQQNRNNGGYFGVGNQAWNNPINLAQRQVPIIPTEYDGMPTAANISVVKTNPLAFNEKTGYSRSVGNNLQSSMKLGWDVPWVEGLKLQMKLSYDKSYTTAKSWREQFELNAYNFTTEEYEVVKVDFGADPKESVLRNSVNQNRRLTLQPAITYNKTFAKHHNVSALLLYEQSSQKSENISATVQGFDLNTLHELNQGKDILLGKKDQAIGGGSYVFNRAGYVGRLNYSYDSKYMAEFVARYDGSVRFPKENRWGFFPAFSAGWRISEEDFFANFKNTIDNLKVRFSAGLLGNDRIGDFQYLNLINPNPPTVYIGDKEYISIYTAGNVNRDITWEKTATYNLGFDLTVKQGLFGMEFDYFYKRTNDILIGSGGIYPPSLGGNYPSTINGGKVRNLGVELVLSHRNKIGEVFYDVRGNIGWSRNKVLEMNESPNVPDHQRRTGRKMGQKLGFKTDGLYQSYDEILNSPTLDNLSKGQIRPGDIKYVDFNGDGKINKEQDYTFIGNSNVPELMYGLNLSASWREFDVSLFFQGAAICDVFLSGVYPNGHVDQTQYTRPFFGQGNSPYFLIKNSWTPDNPNSEFTRLSTQQAEMGNPNGWASDFWLRNGNYLRLKNVQFGYNLKKNIVRKIGLEDVRFTVTGGNLFTWSKLNKYNIDPETPEITNGYYPQQRTFEFGVSVTL